MSISAKEKRIAVLIDAENISANYAEALFEEIAKRGKISFCRAYGDFNAERLRIWEEKFAELGISSFQQDTVSNYKNAADIALVIGAMDLLHWKRAERFYIVTNDGDFTPLANKLKSVGLDVIGVGTSKVSRAFQIACNDFVVLTPKSENLKQRATNTDRRKEGSTVAPKELALAEIEEIILREIQHCELSDGWAKMGELGKRLKAGTPKIIYKDFGYATLSKLLTKSSRFIAEPKHTTPRVRPSTHNKNA